MIQNPAAGVVNVGVRSRCPRKLGVNQLDMAARLMASDRSQRKVAKALGVAASTLQEGMKQRTT